MSSGWRTVVAVIGLGAFSGCQLVLDLGDKVYVAPTELGGEGGASSGEPGGSSSGTLPDGGTLPDAAATTCPTGTKGSSLVAVPNPNGGITCIDATEVTEDQYAAFLAATSNGTDVSLQPAECSGNSTFQVDNDCITYAWLGPFICKDTGHCGNHPQVCVTWCDAYSYCKWAGKRLCGALAGGKLDPSKTLDPKVSQWSNACTSDNRHTYPYGDAFVAKRCQTYNIEEEGRTNAPVGSHPDCQSKEPGYSSVFDLSGNVGEWEDSCVAGTAPAEDLCFARGGSFLEDTKTRCDTDVRFQRGETQPDTGFRCCGP